jgi:predicted nucleic acid-binding protein
MSVLLDTGIVYAYYDRSDRWHARARRLMQGEQRGLILPSPVIPEVDHLLGNRLGARSRAVFYSGIVEGYYLVADLPRDAYARVADLNRQFADLELGFVDAAIVALAEAIGLSRIATADRRHFEPLAAALSLDLVPHDAN